jgi:hypothetical protein
LLVSCGGDETTATFKQYLKTEMHHDPKNGDVYLFIPSTQCINCVQLDGNKLPDALNKRLYVISAIPQKHFTNFQHYFFDKEDKLLELKLVDYENKLVFYDQNRVMGVVKAKIVNPIIVPEACEKVE